MFLQVHHVLLEILSCFTQLTINRRVPGIKLVLVEGFFLLRGGFSLGHSILLRGQGVSQAPGDRL